MSSNMSLQATRMKSITASPSMVVSQTAKAMMADGIDVVNLALGEPDFATPDNVCEAAFAAIRDGRTAYAPPAGEPALRQAIAHKLKADNGLTFDPSSEIMVGVGAKQVIFNALMATLEQGDEVVLLAPYFVSYPAAVELLGGVIRVVQCRAENRFRPLAAELDAAMTERTRWVLVNTPGNPSGAVFTAEDLASIGRVVSAYPKALVLSDEIYEKIVFTGATFTSFGRACPELRDRTLIVNGLSKSHAMTGWRVGYGAGPADLIDGMTKLASQSTTSTSTISQVAATEALLGDQTSVVENGKRYEARRDLLVTGLSEMPLLEPIVPEGAFYLFADCGAMLDRTTPDGQIITNDADAADYLLREGRVAGVPGVAYGLEPFVRFSFAASDAELEKALAHLASAVAKLG